MRTVSSPTGFDTAAFCSAGCCPGAYRGKDQKGFGYIIPTRNISTRDRFRGVIVTGPNRLARCRAGPVHSLRAAVSLGTEPGPSIRAATFNFMIGMRHEAQWHNDGSTGHGSRVTGSSTMRIRTQHVRSGSARSTGRMMAGCSAAGSSTDAPGSANGGSPCHRPRG